MRKQKGNPIHMINQRNGARNVMMQRKYGWTFEVDIHGMRAAEAKKQLELLLGRVGNDIREVVVNHGYHGGKILQEMVRAELKHPRIQRKILSLNSGETTLVLKTKD